MRDECSVLTLEAAESAQRLVSFFSIEYAKARAARITSEDLVARLIERRLENALSDARFLSVFLSGDGCGGVV